MGKVKNEAMARAELMLMGLCVPVTQDEVQFMTEYIMNVVVGKTLKDYNIEDMVKDRICEFAPTNKVTYITTCKVYGMPCIVYLLEAEETPKPFEEDYGSGYPAAFSYVFNLTDDFMCSEFGDSFFEKRGDGYYHRVS